MLKHVCFGLLLLCGCKAKQNTPSFSTDGSVFLQMDLPSPNSIRTGSGAPGIKYWQQQVDHDIVASLDVDTNMLYGSQTVTYTNNSPDTLTFLWFQLEQNVLRKDSIRSRERKPAEENYAGVRVSKLQVNGKDATLHDYGTLARIDFEGDVKSGEVAIITMDWNFPVSVDASIRMGYDDAYKHGPVWEFAQWIPVPCVYDDVYGWNTLPYIGRGEFYTNFGDYNVAITVPSDHLVFASGVLTNPSGVLTSDEQQRLKEAMKTKAVVKIRTAKEVGSIDGGTDKTWKFSGNNIRTFAWATSASYIWDAASVEINDINGNKKRVLCQGAYPEETADVWDEAVSYVQHSIKYYSETLYPYPWPQMSVVRGKAGGMEYPMIVYCRGSSHESLFNVTDHEVGHDWFPMIVNTDERRHAWMDEGFNTFVNHYSLEQFYGDRPHKPDVSKYNASKFKNDLKAINTPPDFLKSRGHLSYRKPGYGMRFLREEIMGEERFDAAFKEYVSRWAFKSPRPADFYRTMEDASGMDLQWFFRGFFEETMQLDQAIESVTQTNDGLRVTLLNLEDWVCPVDLVITCEDDSVHSYSLPVTIWAWSMRYTRTFELPSQARSVTIDPNNAYPDINVTNNAWYFH
ncbi:MAG: M1 family metallopeptidase [Planctomycetes bacterium]|nr:M1 family metallopeptidase [Planctomycetota bacterium]MBL6998163.1 M1 family metallopeptidase [Phycisphaerales bacterium]